MEELLKIMAEIKPGISLGQDTKLTQPQVFDSIELMELVAEIDEHFGIEVAVQDMVPENFRTPLDIYQLIIRLQEES